MKLYYDNIHIKNKISLKEGYIEIPDKGVSLIKGKNGIGKTSLLKNIFFNSCNNCIFVDQINNEIINELTILENIAMSVEKDRLIKIEKKIRDLNLGYLLNLKSNKLSGGEKRIISILRGIFSSKNIILMDEPTNDLDYKMVQTIIKIIKDYSNQKSFLIITHDDRFNTVADKIFTVDNKKIYEYKNKKVLKKESILDEGLLDKRGQDTIILNKIFIKNYFSIALMILLLIISIFRVIGINGNNENLIKEIDSRRIDICIPLSHISNEDLNNGFYPIRALEYIDNDKNLIENLKSISDINQYMSYAPINYSLNLKSTKNYSVYPLEYYNVDEREHYFTLDKLNQGTYNNSKKTHITKDEIIKEIRRLQNIKTKYGNKLEIIYATIILEDNYDFYDFIKEPQVLNLKDDNIYIRSNETILLTNQINLLNEMKLNLIDFSIMAIIIVALNLLYIYSYINIKSKTISILKNYAIDKNIIKSNLSYLTQNKKFKIGSFIILGIINVFVLYLTDSLTLMTGYIIPIYFIFIVNITDKLSRKIINNRIDTIYSWRYR